MLASVEGLTAELSGHGVGGFRGRKAKDQPRIRVPLYGHAPFGRTEFMGAAMRGFVCILATPLPWNDGSVWVREDEISVASDAFVTGWEGKTR